MAASSGARIFICPRCKASYWGGSADQLPDCPHCGYDHRRREGFRFDLLFLMVLIMAMIGFMLLTSTYNGSGPWRTKAIQDGAGEKLPGR